MDGSGRVLGVSVAYVSPQQGAVAVGFAVPSATATRVANELLEHGRAKHAYLGVKLGELTPQIASELRVEHEGVLVYAVEANGPAGKAGMRAGDVVTAVGGQRVTSVEAVFAALRGHEPGEKVSVSYLREGTERTAQVAVADRPS